MTGTPDPKAADSSAETLLIARLKRGEEAAYEDLVRTHGGRLLSVARRFFSDEQDAADALQDTFVSAFRAIDRFEGGSRLSTWLHRIVVNASLMRLRAQQRRPETSIEDLLPRYLETGQHAVPPMEWTRTAESALSSDETRRLVRQAIDELPENYRAVLLLRDIEELATHDVAEMLGVSTNAVKIRLHRARLALRNLLDEHMQGGAPQ